MLELRCYYACNSVDRPNYAIDLSSINTSHTDKNSSLLPCVTTIRMVVPPQNSKKEVSGFHNRVPFTRSILVRISVQRLSVLVYINYFTIMILIRTEFSALSRHTFPLSYTIAFINTT